MAITIPPISELPLPPTKADPNNFAARADDFLGALPEFQVELNTTVTQMNKLVTGLDQGSPIAAWVVGTTYDFPDVVAGSDGYSYRCVDTGVVGEDPVGDDGTHWVRIAEPPLGNPSANGMALTSTTTGTRSWQYAGLGEIPAGITLTGGVVGFDISKTAANQVTVSPGIALDSSGTTPLAMTAATAVAIPATANTIYHLFVVRLTPSGVVTVKAYSTEASAGVDASVDRFRWIGYWVTNGSNACRAGAMRGGELWWERFAENTINDSTNPPAGITTAIDVSSFLPVSRAESVLFGGVATGDSGQVVAVSFTSGTAAAFVNGNWLYKSSGQLCEWLSTYGSNNWVPVLGNNLYWGEGGYGNNAGTLQLAIHAVKVRR